jgi:hypothetical protein
MTVFRNWSGRDWVNEVISIAFADNYFGSSD